jgi:hypothetical protein
MRTFSEIDVLMQKVYLSHRFRWCNPKNGCCCMGCVNISSSIRDEITYEEWKFWVNTIDPNILKNDLWLYPNDG